ncbi:hypothetical protein BB558_003028 [Smittium angustum]|uniref:RBR-type E3 ubiquitin transferase n=1 Tax=Smittium angustum TaxID=133377 RepID=A0A2U1IXC0_SMIAN|nr:hypothetical protein BB558_006576 [Smittium angustum]PWA00887.1 hypothetical protein BB558_003028 [Smittium angustum]
MSQYDYDSQMASWSDYDSENYSQEEEYDYDDNTSSQFIDNQNTATDHHLKEIDFTSLTKDQILARMTKIVENTNQFLELSFDQVLLLLLNNSWKQESLIEKYLEAPSKIAAEAGVSLKIAPLEYKHSPDLFCPIMCEEGEDVDFFALSCGHYYCKDCYSTYLKFKITEKESPMIKCPEHKCSYNIGTSEIKFLLDQNLYDSYIDLLIENFVNSNEHYCWCPAPNCTNPMTCSFSPSSSKYIVPTVLCKCGYKFCFGCKRQNHQPAICKIAELWELKCKDDSETAHWIVSNTKECPGCKATIEKNGGCNHMTCKKCRHEFCWICKGNWKLHKDNYNCNRYVASGTEEDQKVSKSRESLERYLHYYNRFNNHEQSIQLTKKLIKITEQNVESVQLNSSLSWIEVMFLHDAVNILSECRNTLKWTYAFAFFLKKDNLNIMFEDNQSDLERSVEQLNEIVESKISPENIIQTKEKILSLSSYVSKRNEILLNDTLKGYLEDRWVFNAEL